MAFLRISDPTTEHILGVYSSRFTTTTARTSGSQREGKRRIYNHSTLFLDPLIHCSVMSCRHLHFASIVGSMFRPPGNVYMFKGSKNRVIMYYKLYNVHVRGKT